MSRATDSLEPLRHQNVGRTERLVSITLGGAVATFGLLTRSVGGWSLAAIGGYLVYRGATGHCPLLQVTGLRTCADVRPDLDQRFGDHERDIIEEASWESFPASDPPAW